MDERDLSDQPAGEGLTAGLPSFTKYYQRPDGRPLNPKLLYSSSICRQCETLRPDVIGYSLPVMFLLPMRWRVDFLIMCGPCIRRHILTRIWLVALLAHLFAPFLVAWWCVVYVQSFFRRPG